MQKSLNAFYEFIARPLYPWTRVLLAALVLPLALSFTAPLWRISMEAPQYPGGLSMSIYSYKLEGGNNGQHVDEINTLNHYIGMHPIDRAALSDLDWLPFAFGLLALLTLRVAAIGNVSALLDLVVLTVYVSLFAFGRFVFKLWVFGHDLSSDAPVKVEPFMPAVLGTKQIANFTTHSMPALGSLYLGVFAGGLVLVALWHLWKGRRDAVLAETKGPEAVALAR